MSSLRLLRAAAQRHRVTHNRSWHSPVGVLSSRSSERFFLGPPPTTQGQYGSFSSSSFLVTSSAWWPLREPEEGSGFDNFLKKRNSNPNKSNNKKEETKGKNDDSNKDNNNNNNNNNKNNGDNGNMVILATMLLLVAAIMSTSSSSSSSSGRDSRNQQATGEDPTAAATAASSSSHGSGRRGGNSNFGSNNMPSLDLTWGEFLQLLEQDAIFKVVIHQGARVSSSSGEDHAASSTRARVYFKPGVNPSLILSHPESQQQQQQQQQHDWAAAPTASPADQEFLSSDMMSTSTTAASKTPLVYRNLRIGSALSLERKLEEAQRALGKSPHQDIPVQYQMDSSLTTELLSLLPWVLLSGFLIMSFRGAAGRMGGVGATGSSGSGGMFGMGKSTAQKYTKEMNINIGFQVRPCLDVYVCLPICMYLVWLWSTSGCFVRNTDIHVLTHLRNSLSSICFVGSRCVACTHDTPNNINNINNNRMWPVVPKPSEKSRNLLNSSRHPIDSLNWEPKSPREPC
jgi:hypothetical protein